VNVGGNSTSGIPIEDRFVITNIDTAELIKHASNSFLAMKLSYINLMANLCEKTDADIEQVAKGSSSSSIYTIARKSQAFKPGDEWHPERSGGQSSSWYETPAFRPGSFHYSLVGLNGK
jgi:hypothetical protein